MQQKAKQAFKTCFWNLQVQLRHRNVCPHQANYYS